MRGERIQMIVHCDNVECAYSRQGECTAEEITLEVEYNRELKWVQVCQSERSKIDEPTI